MFFPRPETMRSLFKIRVFRAEQFVRTVRDPGRVPAGLATARNGTPCFACCIDLVILEHPAPGDPDVPSPRCRRYCHACCRLTAYRASEAGCTVARWHMGGHGENPPG